MRSLSYLFILLLLLIAGNIFAYTYTIIVTTNYNGTGNVWLKDGQDAVVEILEDVEFDRGANPFYITTDEIGLDACAEGWGCTNDYDYDEAEASPFTPTYLTLDIDGEEPNNPPGGD